MFSYSKDLIQALRHPEQDSAAYFVGKSYLLFVVMGIFVLIATGAFFLDDHAGHAPSNDKGVLCITGLLVTIVTGSFAVTSVLFLLLRLYLSLWRGQVMTPMVMLQIGVLLPVFMAVFTRVFSLPVYFIPKNGNVSIAVSNLFSMLGFLFAGQASYALIRIVNAHINKLIP